MIGAYDDAWFEVTLALSGAHGQNRGARAGEPDSGEITCGNVIQGNYAANLTFPLLGGLTTVPSTRGFVSADCILNARPFRFVNTHLAAFSSTYRYLQALQLASSGPASTLAMPVVLVGDLNSDPSNTVTPPGDVVANNAAYLTFLGYGYADTWTLVNPSTTDPSLAEPGDTSGLNEFVDDVDTSSITSRIDHVLARGIVAVDKSNVTGLHPTKSRTPGGLWASDHAGVIARVRR